MKEIIEALRHITLTDKIIAIFNSENRQRIHTHTHIQRNCLLIANAITVKAMYGSKSEIENANDESNIPT